MGIGRAVASLLARHCRDRGASGDCLTLGRQVVIFDSFVAIELAARHSLIPIHEGEILIQKGHPIEELITTGKITASYGPYRDLNISDEAFFKLIGFKSVESLDVNDYEGCDHVFDLNGVPGHAEINKTFDLIYDGGTLEHVFNVPNALGNIFNFTKIGGCVIHEVPCNNFIDHGFYQFSPTLFTDYYHANLWEVMDVRLVQVARDVADPTTGLFSDNVPYFQMDYVPHPQSELLLNKVLDARYAVHVVVKKTEASTYDKVPFQGYYKSVWR